jgi:hypothetical protein
MLEQRRLEFGEQLLGHVGRVAALPKPRDDFFLAGDMPLPLGDVIVHHPELGRRKGHGPD